jgi:predicted metal-dependent enzyme (double-stranded beta helix superfamily)
MTMTDDATQPLQGEKRATPYEQWQQAEDVPIYTGSYISNLYTLELADWPRVGARGAFVNLADQQHDDTWVIEMAPAGHTTVQHHLFESTIFVLSGRGATTFWVEGGEKQSVEWQRGSVFAPPVNCYYQHFNGDGQAPARMMGVTNAPMILNIFRDPSFIFEDTFKFASRYGGESSFWTAPAERLDHRTWKTNFVPDIRTFTLDDNPGRGEGNSRAGFSLSNNSMYVHTSEFPPGTYKKVHRHGVGAHVIILSGKGYSLLSFEGEDKPRRVDWQDGAMLSPKEMEFHQHFNTGGERARYLAVLLGRLSAGNWEGGRPDQIEYEGQSPAVYDEYAAECEKAGVNMVLPRPKY